MSDVSPTEGVSPRPQGTEQLQGEETRGSAGSAAWSNSFIKRLLARHPYLGNLAATAGIAAPVLGRLAQSLTHVEKLRLSIYEQFGEAAFYVFHLAFVAVLLLLLMGGFGILTLVLDRRLKARRASVGRRVYAASTLGLCCLLVASASIWVWAPAMPHTHMTLSRVSDRWRADLFSTQAPDGGFRLARDDLESDSQAFTTAQALTAILSRPKPLAEAEVTATRAAFEFLSTVELQEAGEGWGYSSYVSWGVTEINAWMALALVRSIQHPSVNALWGTRLPDARQRLAHCGALILSRQMASGGWSPVNDIHEPRFVRTYSTAMSVWALLEIHKLQPSDATKRAIEGGVTWLLANADMDAGGWRPSPFQKHKLESYPGLSAQVIYVLIRAAPEFRPLLMDGGFAYVLTTFDGWLAGEAIPPRGRTLSTLSLPDNDRMHDGDRYLHRSHRMLEGTTYLWFAWVAMACKERERQASQFPELPSFPGCSRLAVRVNEAVQFVTNETSSYVASENLLALDALAGLSSPSIKESP